ncbi:hypothetical protein Flexsi_0265 [Flexistipes sinusarabici DSM 4947]|uniref:Uncharacterized protein n=1 Tax=Flexistipes sinusarabici (strain ATCC 49648 / DSM 4947 / MAS 10) TaxID=717231 RepID=F8E831_FLESM|nr:hypothetical protein [Flexistipes sinusarabici]AEI13955.1 hypothetical protein Flexsi_0265 [Flexistipes sinusarabici DSM 4947]
MDRNSKLMLVGILLVIAFTVFIYYRLNVSKNSMNNIDQKTEQLFSKELKTYSLENIGLKIKSPAPLKELDSGLNAKSEAVIESFGAYGYNMGFFSIRASKAVFRQEGMASLPRIKDSLIQQISGVQGISAPEFSYERTTFSGLQAMRISGKADIDDYKKQLGVRSLLFVDNKTFWQVVVTYAKADKNVADKINEIMDSIELIKK